MIVKLILCVAVAGLLMGCVTAEWTPYVGAQQSWPTSPGGFAREQGGMQIFQSPPHRPYAVLGEVRTRFSGGNALESLMSGPAISRARKAGGDALIMVDASRDYMGTISSGGFNSFTQGSATGSATLGPGTNTVTGQAYGSQVQTGSTYGLSAPIIQHERRFYVIKWL